MKNIKTISGLMALLLLIGCEQELPELQPPPAPSGEPGSADFTNFVAIGNSMTAGFQAAALFNEGQLNSFPAIMAKQFDIVSTNNDEFDQPDINSVNGFNSSFSDPGQGVIRGRLILFDPDGTGPLGPGPAPAATPGIPAPYNTADLPSAYTGNKSELNNFGVPGIILAQALTPLTGGPAGNPAYNPYYTRFASQPGVSTILGDALAVNPTFFSFWLGINDVLGYATTGGAGVIPLTEPAVFNGQFNAAIGQILASDADLKGIVGNIPDVTSMPFFTTVSYDVITLDGATATQLNNGFGGYNAILNALKGPPFNYSAAEVDARKVTFAAGRNKIVIIDETVNDYGDEFDGLQMAGAITPEQRDALIPYEQIRQTTATDRILLTAGAILGTAVEGLPQAIYGLTVPLSDQYILLPSEITAINNTRGAYNNTINTAVSGSNNRLALADINARYDQLFDALSLVSVDGVPIQASFAPPFGIFSEDGLHTNNRGSAYVARIFVEAINEKFGATVPLPNILTFKSTTLPVAP